MRRPFLSAALLAAAVSGASAQGVDYYRQQGQFACMGDVMTVCATYVPYETQIIACMQAHRAQLSAPCRRVFDAGVRAQRQQRATQVD